MERQGFLVRAGLPQTGAALALALATAVIIAASSGGFTEIAGRLAFVGTSLFAIALVLGSARFVGVATLPVLGAALAAAASASPPTWIRSIVLGVLWYIAVELAWDAIERRDGIERTAALDNRRIDEGTTVVTLSLAITTAGFLLTFLAPVRTVLAVGLVVVAILVALGWGTRRLNRSAPPES